MPVQPPSTMLLCTSVTSPCQEWVRRRPRQQQRQATNPVPAQARSQQLDGGSFLVIRPGSGP
jgi:hypothetical protein